MEFVQIDASWESFHAGYAGRFTCHVESRSLALAGRQDDFCVVCLRTLRNDKLFPQLAAQEIHYCPRRFCEDCCVIDEHWRPRSSRFKDRVYDHLNGFVAQTCLLCWKRSWDFVPPILGSANPAWQNVPRDCFEAMQKIRQQDWRTNLNGKHEWRKALISCHDDMSLGSDRQLLSSIVKSLPKKNPKFLTKHGLKMLRDSFSPPKNPSGACADYIFDVQKCFERNFRLTHSVISSSSLDSQYSNIAATHQGCDGHLNQAALISRNTLTDVDMHNDDERQLNETDQVNTNQDSSSITTRKFLNNVSHGFCAPGVYTGFIDTGSAPDKDESSDHESESIVYVDAASPSAYAESSSSCSDIAFENNELAEINPRSNTSAGFRGANGSENSHPSSLVTRKSQRLNRLSRLRSGQQHLLALDSPENLANTIPEPGNNTLNSPVQNENTGRLDGLDETTENDRCNQKHQVHSRYGSGNVYEAPSQTPSQLLNYPSTTSPSGTRTELINQPATKSCQSSHFDEMATRMKTMESLLAHNNADALQEIELLRATITRLQDENEAKQIEIDHLKTELVAEESLQTQLDDMKRERELLHDQNEQLHLQIADYKAKVTELDHQYIVSQKWYEGHVKQLSETINGWPFLYETLQGELDARNGEYDLVKQKLGELEDDLREAQSDYDNLSSYHTELTKTQQGNEKELEVSRHTITGLINSRNKCKERCGMIGAQLKTAEKKLKEQHDTAEEQLDRSRRDLAHAGSEIKQLEDDLGSLFIEYTAYYRLRGSDTLAPNHHQITTALTPAALQRICNRPAINARLFPHTNSSSLPSNQISYPTTEVNEASILVSVHSDSPDHLGRPVTEMQEMGSRHPNKRARVN